MAQTVKDQTGQFQPQLVPNLPCKPVSVSLSKTPPLVLHYLTTRGDVALVLHVFKEKKMTARLTSALHEVQKPGCDDCGRNGVTLKECLF